MKEPDTLIIRKNRRRGPAEAHHGGAWKMAYADFITAMMTLFIVLWIVAHNQNIRSSVAQYFRNPTTVMTGSEGVLDGSTGVLPVDSAVQGEGGGEAQVEDLRETGERLSQTIAESPTLSKFKDQIQITLTRDGLRIELIEQAEGLFFDIGSARMKADAAQLLQLIAGRIGGFSNDIVIEGHTDSRSYGGNGYDNWNLSSDRANAARRVLKQAGIPDGRIRSVNGYADRQLKTPDNPLDFSNRRVTILVTFTQSR